jgi:peptidase E
MNLQLFSTPGDDLQDILSACRQVLEGREDPLIAYLPAASLSGKWQDFTEKAFAGLARVATINTELQTLAEMEAILREAMLVYLPGGNTFLLNHRLHISKIMEYLRRKIAAGLPVVAFSAGTVLCGPNILTSRDMNMVGTGYFNGLNMTPFNFSVHYPVDETGRAFREDWLSEYHVFHENPVILLADGACVQVEGKRTTLLCGEAWILRKGQEKEKISPRIPIAP